MQKIRGYFRRFWAKEPCHSEKKKATSATFVVACVLLRKSASLPPTDDSHLVRARITFNFLSSKKHFSVWKNRTVRLCRAYGRACYDRGERHNISEAYSKRELKTSPKKLIRRNTKLLHRMQNPHGLCTRRESG